jgi:hypothetical protein
MKIGICSGPRYTLLPKLKLCVPYSIEFGRKSDDLCRLLTSRYACLISSTHLLFDKIK